MADHQVKVSFGKYAGWSFSDLPTSYVIWAVNQSGIKQRLAFLREVDRRGIGELEIAESVLDVVSKSACWWSSGIGVASWVRGHVQSVLGRTDDRVFFVQAGPFRLKVVRGALLTVVTEAISE